MAHRLDILDRLHTRLLDIVGTGLRLIPSAMRDADLTGLAHLRDEMIDTIGAYCRFVHGDGLLTHIEGDDAHRRAVAVRVRAGCSDLKGAYDAFTARWVHRDGTLNWPEYRLSAIVMMKRIRDQVRAASTLTSDAEPSAVAPAHARVAVS